MVDAACGRIVERAKRHPLFAEPRHPYTGGLLGSIPRLDGDRDARLFPIRGSVADNIPWDHACAFAPRCCVIRELAGSLTHLSSLALAGRVARCRTRA